MQKISSATEILRHNNTDQVTKKDRGKGNTTLTGKVSNRQQLQQTQQKNKAPNKDSIVRTKQRSDDVLSQQHHTKDSPEVSQRNKQHNINSDKQIQHIKIASNKIKQTQDHQHNTANTHSQVMAIQESSDSDSSDEEETATKVRTSIKGFYSKGRQQKDTNYPIEDEGSGSEEEENNNASDRANEYESLEKRQL